VIDFNPDDQSGTGWTFANCDASGLIHATGLALQTLREYPKDFEVRFDMGAGRHGRLNLSVLVHVQHPVVVAVQ
jgi:hypothetical protein